jgi:hypothetical protein
MKNCKSPKTIFLPNDQFIIFNGFTVNGQFFFIFIFYLFRYTHEQYVGFDKYFIYNSSNLFSIYGFFLICSYNFCKEYYNRFYYSILKGVNFL